MKPDPPEATPGTPGTPGTPVTDGGAPQESGRFEAPAAEHGPPDYLAKMALGALGVVYGDIGTSPLYAVKECFTGYHGVNVTVPNVLGVLSLVFWALVLVIVVKYLTFIMRADNHGEGGILALFALLMPRKGEATGKGEGSRPRRTAVLLLAGLFGAALLYGDGMITPAISVLSAVEGLGVATSFFTPFIIPITVAILVALFLVQRKGTGGIGRVFGPVTLVWFLCIGVLGARSIAHHPGVLRAVNPAYALEFFSRLGWDGFLVLGAVVLVVTGGEALYADMGHFGRKPIRVAWFGVVLPALLLNYFGQGALLIAHPKVGNPFYALASGWALYPLVLVATAATVIASQALISGVFSLTQQAVQLGYWPRVKIVHTSGEARGQIYIPEMNYLLMVACIALVLGFKTSSALAAAYGIAVTGTMAITSILFYAVAVTRWNWSRARAASLSTLFLIVDLGFLVANLKKIREGGWFPIAVAGLVYAVMTTWKRGREALGRAIVSATMPIDLFMEDIARTQPLRVRGTAVFMTSQQEGVPLVLLHHFKHNKMLHEQVVLLSITTENVPVVPAAERVEVTDLGQGFYRVVSHYGFMQLPDTVKILRRCIPFGLWTTPADTSFFLGRETLLITGRTRMARWRKTLFAFLSRNSRGATAFFGLPPNRVVEMGAQIEL